MDSIKKRWLWLAMAGIFLASFASPMLLSRYREPADSLLDVQNTTGRQSGHLGQTLKYVFRITNVSNEPVRILGTQSNCGCTAVIDPLPITLAAGQETKLTVQLSLNEATGEVSRSVRLLVNHSGGVPLMTVQAELLSN